MLPRVSPATEPGGFEPAHGMFRRKQIIPDLFGSDVCTFKTGQFQQCCSWSSAGPSEHRCASDASIVIEKQRWSQLEMTDEGTSKGHRTIFSRFDRPLRQAQGNPPCSLRPCAFSPFRLCSLPSARLCPCRCSVSIRSAQCCSGQTPDLADRPGGR